jgi:hypothetical protein
MKTTQKFQLEDEFSAGNFFFPGSTMQHNKTLSRHSSICHADEKIMDAMTMVFADVCMTIKSANTITKAKIRKTNRQIQKWGRKFPGNKNWSNE